MNELKEKDLEEHKELMSLFEKGGNDAALMLLDKINQLRDEFKDEIKKISNKTVVLESEIKKELPEDARIERLASKIALKLSIIEKGEPGETPSDEKLISLISPLIPKPIKGENGKTPTPKEILKIIKPLIPKVVDGITPSDEKLISLIAPLLPKIPEFKEKTPEEIRDTLISIQEEEEKLPIEAIGFLRKELDELLKFIQRKVVPMGGGSPDGVGAVKAYDISSSLNGVLKTFNIPANWRVISVHLSSFPNALRETTDYTYTPTTITFTNQIDAASSLATGQTAIIVYAQA